MDRAVEAFETDFARWDLHLPPEAVEGRHAGHIRQGGWSIRYNFGHDSRGEYLDYYASPRDVREDPPTDDWHVRLYANGERLALPTVLEAYMYGRDPTWEELERARRPYGGEPSEPLSEFEDFESRPGAEAASSKPAPRRSDPRGRKRPSKGVKRPSGPALSDAASPPSGREGVGEGHPETPLPYLPIDIGLDIELNLAVPATPGSVEERKPSPPKAVSAPPQTQEPERFYAEEDPQSLAPPASQEPPSSLLPTPDARVEADDRPAPITLEVVAEEPDKEAVERDRQEASFVPPVETVETGAKADEITLGRSRASDLPWQSPDASEAPDAEQSWQSEFRDSVPTTVPAQSSGRGDPPIRRKVFARADLVLTSDVTAIRGFGSDDDFRPWWYRPGGRMVAAVAAVIVIGIIAFAMSHRSKASGPSTADDSDSTAAIEATQGSTSGKDPGSIGADSAVGVSQTAATPDAAPQDAAPATPAEAEPAPPASPTTQVTDHGTEDGMARPAGPQSMGPIQPSASVPSHPGVKSPPGTFPKGYSP